MPRRAALTSTAVLAGLAAVPSPAAADQLFTGRTQQDRPATVRIGDDGVVNLVRIQWRTRRCSLSGSFLQNVTGFRRPFDSATPDAFADQGSYTERDPGGIRIRITTTLNGRRVVDPANPAAVTWQGTLKASAVVRRRGRVIDRCVLRSTGFTAQRR